MEFDDEVKFTEEIECKVFGLTHLFCSYMCEKRDENEEKFCEECPMDDFRYWLGEQIEPA